MTTAGRQGHRCYRCAVHDVQGPFRQQGAGDGPELESLDTTHAENDAEIFFTSGYSAREIAQRHQREHGGQIYVNNVSRNVKLRDLSTPVAYAVSKSPVHTLKGPDEWHDKVYRAYWPPL